MTTVEIPADRVAAADAGALDTSVGKAMALIRAFDPNRAIGVSELARRAHVPKSTAYRLLQLLITWGLVDRRGQQYQLGSLLFELGSQIPHGETPGLTDIARPHLVSLYEQCHHVVQLGILSGGDVVYLDKIHGPTSANLRTRVGGRIPAHCCALGKALLAYDDGIHRTSRSAACRLPAITRYTMTDPTMVEETLAGVRRSGYAVDREESRLGINCVAAPIVSAAGRAIAAVSVSGPSSRLEPERLAAAVRRAAAAIEVAVRDQIHYD